MPRRLFLILLLLTAVAVPAFAANPIVKMHLEEANASEAAKALAKAADVEVELYTDQFPPGAPRPKVAQLEERYTFSWQNISFARALRQLCQKFSLMPGRKQGGGYVLYPSQQAAAAPNQPQKRVGLFEKSGYRLFARSISVSSNRSVRFVDGGQDWDHSSMNIEIGAELPEGEAATIAGVERITAKDDLGNLMVSDPNQRFYGGGGWGQFPDEWQGYANLNGPHPRAKKLLWLEGDLMRYKVYRPFRVELPVPATTQEKLHKTIGEIVIDIKKFEPQPPLPPQPAPMPGVFPQVQGSGAKIEAEIFMPNNSSITGEDSYGWGLMPALVTKSGKVLAPRNISNSSGRGDERGTTQTMTVEYTPANEPITTIRFSLVEKSMPEKLFSFRMTNIPLPSTEVFQPRRNLPPPPPTQNPSAVENPDNRPYFEKGGGKLLNRILRGDQTAGEGTLSLGLSVKEGGEWSGVRWIELPVDKDGAAALTDLKPGAYREQRTIQPKEKPKDLPPGRWLNGEVEITVAAGKELTLEPLKWTNEPAPAVKPATPVTKPATSVKKPASTKK